MVNLQKKSQVSFINKLLQDKNNFVLVKIDKTTHQNLESLRKELRKSKASFKVIKNALFEKALNKTIKTKPSFKILREKFFPLKEPSALITFEDDWSPGLKSFSDFIQKEKTLTYKMAILDNTVYGNEETEKIAKLPGKNQLLAQVIGSMKSPMSKFVYALKYNTNKFVYILHTKSKKSN